MNIDINQKRAWSKFRKSEANGLREVRKALHHNCSLCDQEQLMEEEREATTEAYIWLGCVIGCIAIFGIAFYTGGAYVR